MSSYAFALPPDFSDYEWEATAKGCFSEGWLIVEGKQYRLNFYDAARINQEIEGELGNRGVFFEPNLVIVRSVTKAEMEAAVEQLVRSGFSASLMPVWSRGDHHAEARPEGMEE